VQDPKRSIFKGKGFALGKDSAEDSEKYVCVGLVWRGVVWGGVFARARAFFPVNQFSPSCMNDAYN